MRRTKQSLHDALIGLAREKPYDAIAVKEILDRADVGRSTFYTHFRDKDELLEGSIHEMIRGTHDAPRNPDVLERIVAFSRPILEHIDRHRRTAGPTMARKSHLVIHQHLERVLADRLTEDMDAAMRGSRSAPGIPAVHRHQSRQALAPAIGTRLDPLSRNARLDGLRCVSDFTSERKGRG